MRLQQRSTIAQAALVAFCGIAVAGCATGHTWAWLVTLGLSLGGLAFAGCGDSHRRDRPVVDAGPSDAAPEPDARVPDVDGGGTWEQCCVEGYIDTCYCPAGWACNYGWFTACGDGTCEDPTVGAYCEDIDAGPPDAGPPDAGPPDAGGYWEACCVDGVIDTCFCPAGLACNYGWFTDCGGGSCVGPTESCGADAGAGG